MKVRRTYGSSCNMTLTAAPSGQSSFNQLVSATGCGDFLGSSTIFDCLRDVPTARFRSAIQDSPNIFEYSSLAPAWMPRVDGAFLPDTPQALVVKGSVANVPFVTGTYCRC